MTTIEVIQKAKKYLQKKELNPQTKQGRSVLKLQPSVIPALDVLMILEMIEAGGFEEFINLYNHHSRPEDVI